MTDSSLTKEKMLACPFCGSSRLTMRHFFVECGNCAALGPNGNSESQATEKWNKRHSFEPLWRPIAQAPRDGTWVLVAHKCYGLPVVARWHDGDWLSSSNERGLLVDKWSTLPDVQDTRVSSETNKLPTPDEGNGETVGRAIAETTRNTSNTVGSRHKPECAFHEAQADGMQHPSGACDCGATASE